MGLENVGKQAKLFFLSICLVSCESQTNENVDADSVDAISVAG